MAETEELTDQIGELIHRAGELQSAVTEGSRDSSEIKAELEHMKPKLNELHAEREAAKEREYIENSLKEMRDLAEQTRYPSKAHLIGTGEGLGQVNPETNLGTFMSNILAVRQDDNPANKTAAFANLLAMGSYQSERPADSAGVISTNSDGTAKATLTSSTGAGAGFLVPNALVTSVIELATARNPYRELMQVVNDVRTLTVQVPTEGALPVRAQVVAEGATKPNLNLGLPNYTVTLYTLAQIFDISNQLLRHSAGAAEQIVRSKLSRGWALGEAFYILQGSGASEPKGLLTSLGTSGAYFSSFTASATTLAGSSASAIAKAAGAVAGRARIPDGAVVNASDWYIMLAQGTDSAGFFFSPANGPTGIDSTTGELRIWGLRVMPDVNMPTDNLVVGQFGDAQIFLGQDYRIDVSSEAGTRWDTNLTGFRGEEELGFNADPYVASGMFQRVNDFTP